MQRVHCQLVRRRIASRCATPKATDGNHCRGGVRVRATRGGFHHFYANDKAMEGYRTGKFPEGSIIVDEGVVAEEAQGVTSEKGRRSLDVMHKDGSRFQATGGWGYDHFEGDSQASVASAEVRTACFTCHSQRKDHDFVYSTFRR